MLAILDRNRVAILTFNIVRFSKQTLERVPRMRALILAKGKTSSTQTFAKDNTWAKSCTVSCKEPCHHGQANGSLGPCGRGSTFIRWNLTHQLRSVPPCEGYRYTNRKDLLSLRKGSIVSDNVPIHRRHCWNRKQERKESEI